MTELASNPHTLRYALRGECVRCGSCCAGEDCEHLSVADGHATCAIHADPARPEKCGMFPASPPIVFPSCGFSFADLWDGGKIVKGSLR